MITAGFHKRDSIVEYKIMWGWKFRVSTANTCTGTHVKYTPYLKVRQSSESREECHSLSRSRWPTKHHGLVLGQPGVEEWLMADSVQGRHHNVRGTNLMGLHLYLGNLVVPLSPLTLDRHLHKWFTKHNVNTAPYYEYPYHTTINNKINIQLHLCKIICNPCILWVLDWDHICIYMYHKLLIEWLTTHVCTCIYSVLKYWQSCFTCILNVHTLVI